MRNILKIDGQKKNTINIHIIKINFQFASSFESTEQLS
jgi:hypothetical protein